MPDKLSVTVRMYRQGLGDCFLLIFKHGEQEISNMLIDCGLFLGTKNGKGIMTQVAEDIRATVNDKLDVVALTHEHWDHISGFSLAKAVFDDEDFIFDDVWVGWTENDQDEKFNQVRERFKKRKKALRAALNEMKAHKLTELSETVDNLINKFFGEGGVALGMSGADTWKYVLDKSTNQPPTYCTPGQINTLTGVDGVRIYILGPPEDFELLDDEESPEAETYRKHLRMAVTDSFLAAATGDDDSLFDSEAYLPFDGKYRIAFDEAKNDPSPDNFFKGNYGFIEPEPNDWRRIDADWLRMAGELALNIDGITNNTCLAIAIELGESGKVLLFPGDAQFGNWISWQKLKWEVSEPDGSKTEIKINDLLKKTVFYKVGHHGSHNATLRKSGLEIMEHPELVAMIPTNQEFAKKQGKKEAGGWQMPELELMERLEQKAKGRVILADEYGGADDEKAHLSERCKKRKLSSAETKKFLKRVGFGGSFVRNPDVSDTPEPLYVEYTIEV